MWDAQPSLVLQRTRNPSGSGTKSSGMLAGAPLLPLTACADASASGSGWEWAHHLSRMLTQSPTPSRKSRDSFHQLCWEEEAHPQHCRSSCCCRAGHTSRIRFIRAQRWSLELYRAATGACFSSKLPCFPQQNPDLSPPA